ncbi:MAG: MBL fold metallo-hydrolase [Bacilli bacterium]|nr:MBL fold metallo-hydrolase [Bacilli bacterium]
MNISINTQSSIKIGNIYFDPYLRREEVHDADIIFITHSHYDHFDINSINNIKNDNTIIVVPDDKEILNNLNFDENNILIVKPNNNYEVHGIKFSTVPSYNINKPFHKYEYGWVGYVINISDTTYYVMGDTDLIDEAKSVICDYLFIPIGGTYTMDYKEASTLCNIIKPKIVTPIHYGSIVGKIEDGYSFKELVNSDIEVNLILK